MSRQCRASPASVRRVRRFAPSTRTRVSTVARYCLAGGQNRSAMAVIWIAIDLERQRIYGIALSVTASRRGNTQVQSRSAPRSHDVLDVHWRTRVLGHGAEARRLDRRQVRHREVLPSTNGIEPRHSRLMSFFRSSIAPPIGDPAADASRLASRTSGSTHGVMELRGAGSLRPSYVGDLHLRERRYHQLALRTPFDASCEQP